MTGSAGRPWALVTGGARRLGRVLVEAAAEAGFAVAVHAHRARDAGAELVAALGSRDVPAVLVTGDLSRAETPAALVDELASAERTPSLLVNSAALFEHDRLATVDVDRFDRQFAVNLRAPLLLAQAFAGALPATMAGHIVNLADARVYGTSPHYLSYSLSKAGVVAMTRRLAQELAPRIRVNAIAPGLVLADAGMSAARATALTKRYPLAHGGTVEDIAAAARFLFSASSITGEVICVDGGAHLGERRA